MPRAVTGPIDYEKDVREDLFEQPPRIGVT